jgi:hypothetical protein
MRIARGSRTCAEEAIAAGPGGGGGGATKRWLDGLGKLSPAARALAGKALDDLKAVLPDLPAGSLAADWSYLCKQMAHDLRAGAPAALDKLRAVRAAVIAAAARPPDARSGPVCRRDFCCSRCSRSRAGYAGPVVRRAEAV